MFASDRNPKLITAARSCSRLGRTRSARENVRTRRPVFPSDTGLGLAFPGAARGGMGCRAEAGQGYTAASHTPLPVRGRESTSAPMGLTWPPPRQVEIRVRVWFLYTFVFIVIYCARGACWSGEEAARATGASLPVSCFRREGGFGHGSGSGAREVLYGVRDRRAAPRLIYQLPLDC